MNHSDPDPATLLPSQPAAHRRLQAVDLMWQRRPTDPLRVSIVTAFCTSDMGAPPLSYMPRLPR